MSLRVALTASALALAIAPAAQARSTPDPVGDWVAGYTGPENPDLDVVSFSVDFDAGASLFRLGATMAGPIDAGLPGVYVIGVDTGKGAARPFGTIGNPNVIFDQAILIQKSGAATLGASSLTAIIDGSSFSLIVPLSLLPSTGASAERYSFNLWPRASFPGPLSGISDFAPDNARLSAVPEPATWAFMIAGFGMAGTALRRRVTKAAARG